MRFENAPEPVLFCDHFIRAQCVSKDLATWLRVYADIDRFRRHIDLKKVSSAGQNTISQARSYHLLFRFHQPQKREPL